LNSVEDTVVTQVKEEAFSIFSELKKEGVSVFEVQNYTVIFKDLKLLMCSCF
jgi:hypothetical protein